MSQEEISGRKMLRPSDFHLLNTTRIVEEDSEAEEEVEVATEGTTEEATISKTTVKEEDIMEEEVDMTAISREEAIRTTMTISQKAMEAEEDIKVNNINKSLINLPEVVTITTKEVAEAVMMDIKVKAMEEVDTNKMVATIEVAEEETREVA